MCTLIHNTHIYTIASVMCLAYFSALMIAQRKKINRGDFSPAFLFKLSLLQELLADLPFALVLQKNLPC